METKILEALEHIDVSRLTYAEWVAVGMSLKQEGYSLEVWDNWSKNDTRYKPSECERKWRTFTGSSNPVGAGTIIQLAKDNGWSPSYYENEGVMDWDDIIEYDGESIIKEVTKTFTPTQQLIQYLKTLFKDNEFVSYVTSDVFEHDGKWQPGKGYCDRTASELIALLKKHPDDIGAVLGDSKPECGAWIRFNPVDGKGAKNENVTRFTYALVESDTIPIEEQDELYRKLELPIACLVHSGGKSLHAIVHIDAKDYEEYQRRVSFLYDYLESHGLPIDKANRNPSRLSRMPGIVRNGKLQKLVDTNIGKDSWDDWVDFIEGDELTPFEYPSDLIEERPALAPELVGGLLRLGHKMIVQGASKAGKSFFLLELGICLSEGMDFLGFNCRKSKVLYINLEIDRPSCFDRVFKIYDEYKITKPAKHQFTIWNLRGKAMPLDKLVPKIIKRIKGQQYNAIIIDPIYKVITGDENNATEMGHFCNQFDKICDEAKCSVIYAHHHSKGAQGGKFVQDRSSGSGVFARDPDTIIDLSQLDISKEVMNKIADSEDDTAWLMTCITRDFKQPKPRKIWFKYPIHVVDETGALDNVYVHGDSRKNLKQNKNGTAKTLDEKETEIIEAFNIISAGLDEVKVTEVAQYLAGDNASVESKRKYIYEVAKQTDKFTITKGKMKLVSE